MRQPYSSVAIFLLTISAGVGANAQPAEFLVPDSPLPKTLRNDEVHVYRTTLTGDVRIRIDHFGRGVILTVCKVSCDDAGNWVIQSANWRGPEHFHSAVLSIPNDAVLQIESDEGIAPAGDYRISISQFSRTNELFQAERLMSLGANSHMQHYQGEQDARMSAAEYFESAAVAFHAVGERRRLADALYEAAVVRYYLGQNQLADRRFRAAEMIWREFGDERGIASAENMRGLVYQLLGNTASTGATSTGLDDLLDEFLAADTTTDSRATSIELFESAADRRERLGDAFFLAQTKNNTGLFYRELGDGRQAVKFFREALSSWQGTVDLLAVDPSTVDFDNEEIEPWLFHSLTAMMNLGWAYDLAAQPDIAEQYLVQSLALSEYLKRGRIAAEIRNNFGTLMYRMGNLQSALILFEEALAYFESESRDETWAAEAHNNIGLVYQAAGDSQRASTAFGKALRLRSPERDPVGRAETLRNMALLQLEASNFSGVAPLREEALMLLGETSSIRSERAHWFDLEGQMAVAAGDLESAVRHFDLAMSIYTDTNDLRGEANTRTNRALAFHRSAQYPKALSEFEIALEIARRIESLQAEFRILSQISRSHFDRDQFGLALEVAGDAISVSEMLRNLVQHPALLREYAAVQQDAYDLLVASAIRTGKARDAWITSDHARARRFTELLLRTGAPISSASEATDHARYGDLRWRIAALTELRSEYLAAGNDDASANVLDEMTPLLNEMDSLTLRYSDELGLTQTPLQIQSLQSALEPGDLLLEFFVSPLGTGMWQIEADAFNYVSLPSFDEIELAARNLRNELLRPGALPNDEITTLSGMLLEDSSSLLDQSTRLIVVPDGPLHAIPFSILVNPSPGPKEPLILSHEVAYLPSAAALLKLRSRETGTGKGVAVLADPVFDLDDPRISDSASPTLVAASDSIIRDIPRGASVVYPGEFERLLGTRRESLAIKESAGNVDVDLMLDTDASRDLVLSGKLDTYQVLHFATHGVLDIEEPALSALVLSAVDQNGLQRPKFLLAQDIVSADISADLVVLSGCDTGFGRIVRGEGLLSLSRAFFQAGASQVISSLWQVPDIATAELMGRFYQYLLQDKKTPATALRKAQIDILHDPRWRSPYFWAAFIAQGDWTSGDLSSLSTVGASQH